MKLVSYKMYANMTEMETFSCHQGNSIVIVVKYFTRHQVIVIVGKA